MLKIFKKIFTSKLFRITFSVVLIYFAFRKVDIVSLFKNLREVPLWFVISNIIISFFIVFLISVRWSLLLFPKIKIKTILTFTRASFLASYYSLIFPTSAAGDVLKWIVIDRKYSEIPKTKVLGSIILDRFIGFSMFMLLALISAVVSRKKGINIPDYIFYLLVVLTILCLLVYLVIYFFDASKFLPKVTFLHKLDDAFDSLTSENKKKIIKCLLISLMSETIWILQAWFISWKFGVGISIFSIFAFMTIISMILVLPISIGGFGAREQLFLFFFSQAGGSNESILLMSTFLGILGIINALFGGVLSFFDQETKGKLKSL